MVPNPDLPFGLCVLLVRGYDAVPYRFSPQTGVRFWLKRTKAQCAYLFGIHPSVASGGRPSLILRPMGGHRTSSDKSCYHRPGMASSCYFQSTFMSNLRVGNDKVLH